MAGTVPTRLTAAAGRKFGFTVGGAFLAIGALLLWRQKDTAASIMLGLGTALALAALVAPRQLGPVERAWMGLAHALSKVTTPIIMAIIYFVVFTPIALIRRRAGNPMVRQPGAGGTYWVTSTRERVGPESLTHQY